MQSSLNDQISNVFYDSFAATNNSDDYGHLLITPDFNIVFANPFFNKYLAEADISQLNGIQVFEILNTNALKFMNKRIYNPELLLGYNNLMITRIHQFVVSSKTPVSLIFFVAYRQEVSSFLVTFVPILDKSQQVPFIQIMFSPYDYWGVTDMHKVFDRSDGAKSGDVIMLGKSESNLPIKLSTRQEEIVFLLSLGVNLRQASQILHMSYGTITSTLKNLIYPKFNIYENNVNLLIEKAIAMGYNKVIPQSLCCPAIVILDAKVREKLI